MRKIEPYAASSIYDPPMYSQAVKVTGTETMLFIAGQVAYGREGAPMHAGDFKAQARAALQCLKAQVEAGGEYRQGEHLPDRHTTSRRLRPDPRGVLRKEDAGAYACGSHGARSPRIPH
jgi:hypothetical protein